MDAVHYSVRKQEPERGGMHAWVRGNGKWQTVHEEGDVVKALQARGAGVVVV